MGQILDIFIFNKNKFILCFLITLEIIFLVYATNFEYFYNPDATEYLRLAEEIKSGEFFKKDYDLDQGLYASRKVPPLYSFFLAGLSFIFPKLIFWAYFFSILLTAFTFIPIYFIGKKLGQEKIGLLALVFFILNPFNPLYGGAILTEPLFILLFNATLIVGFLQFDKMNYKYSLLAGVLSGLAYTTRTIGVGLFPVLIFFSLIYYYIKKISLKRILPLLLFIITGYIVVAFPYWLHIRIHTGRWGLIPYSLERKIKETPLYFSHRKPTLPNTNYLDPRERTENEEQPFTVLKFIKRRLVFSIKYLQGYLKALKSIVFGGIFFHYYFFFSRIRKYPREKILLEAYLLIAIGHFIFLLGISLGFFNDRYLYPILPLGMILGASGWIQLTEKMKNYFSQKSLTLLLSDVKKNNFYKYIIPVSKICSLLPFFILILYFLESRSQLLKNIKPLYSFELGAREVAHELKERGLITSPGKSIIDLKFYIPYYLNGSYTLIPKTYPELLNLLATGDNDYLVADSFTLKRARPLLMELVIGYQPPMDYKAYKPKGKILILRDGGQIIKTPIPGTRIIYSRYFPEYEKIITVYDLKPSGKEPDEKLTLEQIHQRTKMAYKKGYLYDAIKYAKQGLEQKPDDKFLLTYLVRSYFIFFKLMNEHNISVTIEEFLISDLWENVQKLLAVDSENKEVLEILGYLKKIQEKNRRYRDKVLLEFEKKKSK